MNKYRILQLKYTDGGKSYIIQKRFLGFLWWVSFKNNTKIKAFYKDAEEALLAIINYSNNLNPSLNPSVSFILSSVETENPFVKLLPVCKIKQYNKILERIKQYNKILEEYNKQIPKFKKTDYYKLDYYDQYSLEKCIERYYNHFNYFFNF
jgi:hypothetical protein